MIKSPAIEELRLDAALEAQLLRQTRGWLVGVSLDTTLAVLSILPARSVPTEPDINGSLGCIDEAETADVRMLVPAGLRIVGACIAVSNDSSIASISSAAASLITSIPAQLTNASKPLIAVIISNSRARYFLKAGATCQEVQCSAALEASWLNDHFTLLRCHVPVSLDCFEEPTTIDGSMPRPDAIAAVVEKVSSKLCSPSAVYLGSQDDSSLMYSGDSSATIDDSHTSPISVTPFVRQSPAGAAPSGAPVLSWQPITDGKAVVWHSTTVQLDVLCYLRRGMCVAEAVSSVLQPAMSTQLQVVSSLLERISASDGSRSTLLSLRALHFKPPGLAHIVTAVYPLPLGCDEVKIGIAEASIMDRRLQLHRLLGLPENRVLLRLANALTFGSDSNESTVGGRLSNVHRDLPPSGIQSGTVHLLSGSYDYHHYMQDKFDDKGWGCAYRSLQTIASWFQRQHYVTRAPPSHREVQHTLIAIGDKEPVFLGSRQWVGAVELSFVLDELFGVTCKIINVARGSDLPDHAREIAHHFDTQGTPIMIGGGVLAYTLLGIDYNNQTGDVAFLILDPHYTGVDDISRIQKGKWIAWKRPGDKAAAGGDLFVNNAFYNLLCPQRPNLV